MVLTSPQRDAQRSLVGLIRAGSAVVSRRNGLCIWRARGSEEWQVGVEEISRHLETLSVPFGVSLVIRGAREGRPKEVGFEIQVAWDELDAVTRWAPSLKLLMDAVDSDFVEVPLSKPTNRGRKLHFWAVGERAKDGSFIFQRCKNCGLSERIYTTDAFKRDFLDSSGNVLEFERMPQCPKVLTW